VLLNPLARREARQQGFIESTRRSIVHVLQTRALPELGLPETGRQASGTALGHLTVDQEPQALLEAEGRALWQGHLLAERVIHTRQA
jgi:hypothetical protein